jgi:YHS domain-containing protein
VEPKWTSEAATKYMAALEPRRQRFVEVARRWVADVIEPRMAAVGEPFANAQADRHARNDRSTWWFGYCERYPVTARLEISVAHNEPIEQIQLRYELDLTPTFFKYDAHDKLVMRLEAVDDQAAAEWVERKLLEFLDTYLAIDRGREDFDDEPVTDPVCGMRVRRSAAAASSDYKGHAYFFCSLACRNRFDRAPEQYVTVRI